MPASELGAAVNGLEPAWNAAGSEKGSSDSEDGDLGGLSTDERVNRLGRRASVGDALELERD